LDSAHRQNLPGLGALHIQPDLFGKQVPPKPVAAVTNSGVEYSADGDGKTGWIVVTEIASATQLRTIQVFRIHTHWLKGEEDNQWVFISDLKLDKGTLLIKDERSRCYRLDLSTKRVKAERCHRRFTAAFFLA
jgi:hypothetical protein